jgi:hypothetical protein
MKSWYEQEYCYLSPLGKTYVDGLVTNGFTLNLAMELAFHLIPDTELYELPGEKEHVS